MNRRTYLKLAGASGVAAGLAGCSGLLPGPEEDRRETDTPSPMGTDDEEPTATPDGTVTYRGMEFDTVLDAERDLLMDANGNRPIDEKLLTFMERDRALLEFGPGRYRFDDSHRIERAIENVGIVGRGDSRRDVVFWTPDSEGKDFLNVRGGGSGFLLENVTFDHMEGAGSIGSTLRMQDRLHVHNVEHVGFNPTDNEGAVDNLSPQILSPDGRAVVERFVRTGPTDIVSHGHLDGNANEGAIWLGRDHVGELVIRNSRIENTGTNAVYASRVPGNVVVEDSTFVNNNQASLRIGGKGTVVRGCRFLVDTDDAHPGNRGSYINPNGIIWETGPLGETGGRIENCEFVYRSAPEDTKAAIWADGSAGGFAVENTVFRMGVPGVTAIRADDPEKPRLGVTAAKPWGVTLSGVVVEASAGVDGAMVQITGRPDSVLDGCCFSVPDARGVIELSKSPGSAIRNLNVTHDGDVSDAVDVISTNESPRTLLRDIDVTDTGCGSDAAGNSTPDLSSSPAGN
ncbi:hypothetical protein [Halobaculum sp. EA56]|uniref:hypothetical protein n=1 Tax=Halobaculum sp. EA56 TaxID=3421648 RepID=UPI003EB6BDEF